LFGGLFLSGKKACSQFTKRRFVAFMKISSRSASAAVTVMVPNSLGPAKLLLAYGNLSSG
jgi:hypothetical protein